MKLLRKEGLKNWILTGYNEGEWINNKLIVNYLTKSSEWIIEKGTEIKLRALYKQDILQEMGLMKSHDHPSTERI